MDGPGGWRRKTSKGQAGHALVRKGRGIAGIDAAAGGHREPELVRRIFEEGNQALLCGAAGDEFAHDAADHVQVDVQHHLFQLPFMVGAVGFGAQKAQLFSAAPDEPKAPPMRRFHEPFRYAQDTDGPGHVVVAAAGQGCGIVVCCQDHPLVDLPGEFSDQVMGLSLI